MHYLSALVCSWWAIGCWDWGYWQWDWTPDKLEIFVPKNFKKSKPHTVKQEKNKTKQIAQIEMQRKTHMWKYKEIKMRIKKTRMFKKFGI